MRQSITLQSSARVWVVVMGGRRGRPEIVAGRLMTRPEALRVAADMAEAYPSRGIGYVPAPVAVRWRCRSCAEVRRVRPTPRVCWLCGGTVERQAVRS